VAVPGARVLCTERRAGGVGRGVGRRVASTAAVAVAGRQRAQHLALGVARAAATNCAFESAADSRGGRSLGPREPGVAATVLEQPDDAAGRDRQRSHALPLVPAPYYHMAAGHLGAAVRLAWCTLVVLVVLVVVVVVIVVVTVVAITAVHVVAMQRGAVRSASRSWHSVVATCVVGLHHV